MKKLMLLKKSNGNFDSYLVITHSMKYELNWWSLNIFTQNRKISRENPGFIIETDASGLG